MFSLSGRDPPGPHSPGQIHLAGPSPGGYHPRAQRESEHTHCRYGVGRWKSGPRVIPWASTVEGKRGASATRPADFSTP